MSENVAQWLAEIQSLQRQVKTLQQEREQAYASADNWRKLYEGEAQQRQREVTQSAQKVEELQQALAAFKSTDDGATKQLESEILSIQRNSSVAQLQNQLVAAKKECDRLKSLLKAEQAEHEKTRESLTAALGDAVDL
ncbi:MAG: hypothetical protein ABG776_20175, partial [Cyanobacteria bacterium J06555_13]